MGFSWLLGQMYLVFTEKMKKHKFPARWAGTASKFILLKYGRLKQKIKMTVSLVTFRPPNP